MTMFLTLIFTVLALPSISTSASLPRISLDSLKAAVTYNDVRSFSRLQNPDGQYSAFAVTHAGYSAALESYREAVPPCFKAVEAGLAVRPLADGSARLTHATADASFPACVRREATAVAETFDEVEVVVANLVEKIVGRQLR